MKYTFSLHKTKKLFNTVNVLKFQTLFSFCFQLKCGLSRLEFTKYLSEEKTGRSSLIWVCPVCLGLYIYHIYDLKHVKAVCTFGAMMGINNGITNIFSYHMTSRMGVI